MLKHGLKLDQVHAYRDLSMSQLEEKITWTIEMTSGSNLRGAKHQEKLALIVIINIGDAALFLESEQ